MMQFYAPLSKIIKYHSIFLTGTMYKIKCEPVDPLDLFRGRYVTLNFNEDSFSCVYNTPIALVEERIAEHKKSRNTGYVRFPYYTEENLYVSMTKDEEGFLKIDSYSETKPEHSNYLCLSISRYDIETNKIKFNVPFDRTYMNEKYAPEAERILRWNSNENAYVEVYIKNGEYSKVNLFVDGKSIHEYIDEKLAQEREMHEEAIIAPE